MHSDKIIGFQEGKNMEEGTHKELLYIPNGIYQNLVNMQNYKITSDSSKFYFISLRLTEQLNFLFLQKAIFFVSLASVQNKLESIVG